MEVNTYTYAYLILTLVGLIKIQIGLSRKNFEEVSVAIILTGLSFMGFWINYNICPYQFCIHPIP